MKIASRRTSTDEILLIVFFVFCRFDLEIQLNCYHDNDRQELCNWPLGVSVLVNNKPVQIERVC